MTPRFPALQSVAAVTVLTFTVTTLLPAGWTWAAPDTMRVQAGKETDVRAGLEEALNGQAVPAGGLEERPLTSGITRREFFKRVGAATATVAVAGSSLAAQPSPPPAQPAPPPVVAPAAPRTSGQPNRFLLNRVTHEVRLPPQTEAMSTQVKPRDETVWSGIADEVTGFRQWLWHQFGWDALPPPVERGPPTAALRRDERAAWAPTDEEAQRAGRKITRSYIEWAPWTVTLDQWRQIFEALRAVAAGAGQVSALPFGHSRVYLGAYGVITGDDQEWEARRTLAARYGITVVPLLGDPVMALDPTVAENQVLELLGIIGGQDVALDIEPKEWPGYNDPNLIRRGEIRKQMWTSIFTGVGSIQRKLGVQFAQPVEQTPSRITVFVPPELDELAVPVPAGASLVYMAYKTIKDEALSGFRGVEQATQNILSRFGTREGRVRLMEHTGGVTTPHSVRSGLAIDLGAPPQGGEFPWWEQMEMLPAVSRQLFRALRDDPSFSGEIVLHPRDFSVLLAFLKDGGFTREQRALYEGRLERLRVRGALRRAADFVLLGRGAELPPGAFGAMGDVRPEQRAREQLTDLFRRLAAGATGGGSLYAHWATVFRTIRNSLAIGKYQFAYDANLLLLDPAFGAYYSFGLIGYSTQFGRETRIQAVAGTPAVQLVAKEPMLNRDGRRNPKGGDVVLASGELMGEGDALYGLPDNGYDLEVRVTVVNPSAERFTGNVLGYLYTGHGLPAMVESEGFTLERGEVRTVTLQRDGLRAWRYHEGSILRMALGVVNGTRGRAGEFADMVGLPGYNMELLSARLQPPSDASEEARKVARATQQDLQRRVAEQAVREHWTPLMVEAVEQDLGMAVRFEAGDDDPASWLRSLLGPAKASGFTHLMVSAPELMELTRTYQQLIERELRRGHADQLARQLQRLAREPEVLGRVTRLSQLIVAAHDAGLRVVWTVDEAEAGADPVKFFRVLSVVLDEWAVALGKTTDGLALRPAQAAAPRTKAIRELVRMFDNAQLRFHVLSRDPQEAAYEPDPSSASLEILGALSQRRGQPGLAVLRSPAMGPADPKALTARLAAAATPEWLTRTAGIPTRFLPSARRLALEQLGIRSTAALATGLISPLAPWLYHEGTRFHHYTLVHRAKDLQGPGLWVAEVPAGPGQADFRSPVTLETQELEHDRMYALSTELVPSQWERPSAGILPGLPFVVVPGQRPVILNPHAMVSVPVAGAPALVFGQDRDGTRTVAFSTKSNAPRVRLVRDRPGHVLVQAAGGPAQPLEDGGLLEVTLDGRRVVFERREGGVLIRVVGAGAVTLWEVDDQVQEARRSGITTGQAGTPHITSFDLTRRGRPVPPLPEVPTHVDPTKETMQPPSQVGVWIGRTLAKVAMVGGALVALTRMAGRIRDAVEQERVKRSTRAEMEAGGRPSRTQQSLAPAKRVLKVVGAALFVGTAVALVSGAFPAIAAAVPALGFLKFLAVPAWLTTLLTPWVSGSLIATILQVVIALTWGARLLLAILEARHPRFRDTASPFWAWVLPILSRWAIPVTGLITLSMFTMGLGTALSGAVMGALKAPLLAPLLAALLAAPSLTLWALAILVAAGLAAYLLPRVHLAVEQGWRAVLPTFRSAGILVAAGVGLGWVFGFGVPTLAGLTLLKLFQGIGLLLATAGLGQMLAGFVARRATGWRGLNGTDVTVVALVMGAAVWTLVSAGALVPAIVLGTVGGTMLIGLIPGVTEGGVRHAGSIVAPIGLAFGAKALWTWIGSVGWQGGVSLLGTFGGLMLGAGIAALAAAVLVRTLHAKWMPDLRQPPVTRWVAWRSEQLARNAVDTRSADAQTVLTPAALHALGLGRYRSLDHLIAQTDPQHSDRREAIRAMQGWYIQRDPAHPGDLILAIRAADPAVMPPARRLALEQAARAAVTGDRPRVRLTRNEWREIERQLVPIQAQRDGERWFSGLTEAEKRALGVSSGDTFARWAARHQQADILSNGFARERQRADILVQLDDGAQLEHRFPAWALSDMVQRLRVDETAHGIFPAIYVKPGPDYNFFYFGVGLLGQVFLQASQALQYIISMVMRAGRGHEPGSNVINPLTGFIHSDMETRLWGFIIEVQGRWLLGHLYVMMEAFRGQTFHWDPDALRPARYERSYDGLSQVIASLMGRNDFLSRTAAYYAAFPEWRNLWYGTGERAVFKRIDMRSWDDPGEGAGNLTDDQAFGTRRWLPGQVATRIIGAQGNYIYMPFGVEARADATGVARLVATDRPEKFNVMFPAGTPTKAYWMGVALSIFQKQLITRPNVHIDPATGVGTIQWVPVAPDRDYFPEVEAGRAAVAERRFLGHDEGARHYYHDVADRTAVTGEIIPPPSAGLEETTRRIIAPPARDGVEDLLYELGYDGYRGRYGRVLQKLYRVVDILTLKRWDRRGPKIMDAQSPLALDLSFIGRRVDGAWQAVVRVLIPYRDLAGRPADEKKVIEAERATVGRLTTRQAIREEKGPLMSRVETWPADRLTLGRVVYHIAPPFWAGVGVIVAIAVGWLPLTWPAMLTAVGLIGLSRFVLEPLAKDLIPISYWKFRQAAIVMGLKAHYDPRVVLDMVVAATGTVGRLVSAEQSVADYQALLRDGQALVTGDPELYALMLDYSRTLSAADYAEDPNRSPRAWVRNLAAEIAKRLRGHGWTGRNLRAVQHWLLRLIQGEHMAVGNRLAWDMYHRSRDPKVMRGGDVNAQFSVAGGENWPSLTLALAARVLGAPLGRRRSWASAMPSAQVGGLRMPSQMFRMGWAGPLINGEDSAAYDTDPLNRLVHSSIVDLEQVVRRGGQLILVSRGLASLPASAVGGAVKDAFKYARIRPGNFGVADFGAIQAVASAAFAAVDGDVVLARRMNPLEAYLDHADGHESVNDFYLEHSWLEPDLEAVDQTLARRSADELRQAGLSGQMHPETADSGLIPLADNPHRYTPLDRVVYRWSHRLDTDGFRGRVRPGRWLNRLGGFAAGGGTAFLGWKLIWAAAAASAPPVVALGILASVAVAAVGVVAAASALLTLRRDAQVRDLPPGDGVRAISLIPGLLLKWPSWLLYFKIWVPIQTAVFGYYRSPEERNTLRRHGLSAAFEVPYSQDLMLVSRYFGIEPERFAGMYHDLEYPYLIGPAVAFFPGMPIGRWRAWTRAGTKVQGRPVTMAAARRLALGRPWTAPLSAFNYLPSAAWDIGKAFAEDTLFGWIMAYSDSLAPKTPAVSIQKLDFLFSRYDEIRDDGTAHQRAMAFFKGMDMALTNVELAEVERVARQRPTRQLIAEIAGLLQYLDGMRFAARDEVATGGGLGAGMYSYLFTSFTGSQLFGQRVGHYAPGEVEAFLWFLVFQRMDQMLHGALARQLHAMNAAFDDNPLHDTTLARTENLAPDDFGPRAGTLTDPAVMRQLLGTDWTNPRAPAAGGWFTDPRITLAAVKAQLHDKMVEDARVRAVAQGRRDADGEVELVALARKADQQVRSEHRAQFRDQAFRRSEYYQIMQEAARGFTPKVETDDGRDLAGIRDTTRYSVRTIGWMDVTNLDPGGRYRMTPTDQQRQLRNMNDLLVHYGKTRVIVAGQHTVLDQAKLVTAHPLGTPAPTPSTPIAPPVIVAASPVVARPAAVVPATATVTTTTVTATQTVGHEEPPTLLPGIILMDAAARAVPVLTAHGIATVGVATSPTQAEALIAAGLEDSQLVVAGAAPGQFRWAAGSLDEALAVARARLKLQAVGTIQVVTVHQFSVMMDMILRRAGVGLEEVDRLLDEARSAIYA